MKKDESAKQPRIVVTDADLLQSKSTSTFSGSNTVKQLKTMQYNRKKTSVLRTMPSKE